MDDLRRKIEVLWDGLDSLNSMLKVCNDDLTENGEEEEYKDMAVGIIKCVKVLVERLAKMAEEISFTVSELD